MLETVAVDQHPVHPEIQSVREVSREKAVEGTMAALCPLVNNPPTQGSATTIIVTAMELLPDSRVAAGRPICSD
jgi:hypothetical protein